MTCNYEYLIYPGIVNFKFKDFEAAVGDLSACVKLDKDNKSAYTYLVCSTSEKYVFLDSAYVKFCQSYKGYVVEIFTYCCVGFGIVVSW